MMVKRAQDRRDPLKQERAKMKPKAIIFDLDNCLSDDRDRIKLIDWTQSNMDRRYETYHSFCEQDRFHLANFLFGLGSVIEPEAPVPEILCVTARPVSVLARTEKWLRQHLFGRAPSWRLFMRRTGDSRSSVELKRAITESLMIDYDILHAFDDRTDVVEMYQELGLEASVLKIHDQCAMTPPLQIESARLTGNEVIQLDCAVPSGVWKPEEPAPLSATEDGIAGGAAAAVPGILEAAAKTFRERNAVYGSNYEMVGPIMAILFPKGVPVELLRHDAFHLFELIIVKLSRLAISGLTHKDSAHDTAVYAAMIESIIQRNQQNGSNEQHPLPCRCQLEQEPRASAVPDGPQPTAQ